MQHFRNHLYPSYKNNSSISTAILEIKLDKKLHAFQTRYVNKHALSAYNVMCIEDAQKGLDFHCNFVFSKKLYKRPYKTFLQNFQIFLTSYFELN